jgi:hypothetical protein
MNYDLKTITAEDWIIVRLVVLCMEVGKQRPSQHIDLFRSIMYLYKKYGPRLASEAYQLIKEQQ